MSKWPMTLRPYTLTEPSMDALPLVVDSPHSGRIYPVDFAYTCPLPMLRQTEDFLVDELVAGAVDAGATLITAEFPRCYIDVNRAPDDIDQKLLATPAPIALNPTERTALGLGLVRRLCKSGIPVYAAPLPYSEVERRVAAFHAPYHAILHTTLHKHRAEFGVAHLINAHSMPAFPAKGDLHRPDIELGDRDGTTCAAWLTNLAQNTLQDLGYKVRCNDLFKGQEIVRRYGQPHNNFHALQIEINRGLYMNEDRLEKRAGFTALQNDLTRFFQRLVQAIKEQMPSPSLQEAAE